MSRPFCHGHATLVPHDDGAPLCGCSAPLDPVTGECSVRCDEPAPLPWERAWCPSDALVVDSDDVLADDEAFADVVAGAHAASLASQMVADAFGLRGAA